MEGPEENQVYVQMVGDVILDTGCRTAVAGAIWHQNFQTSLRDVGLDWLTVSHEEVFRFGAGKPISIRWRSVRKDLCHGCAWQWSGIPRMITGQLSAQPWSAQVS